MVTDEGNEQTGEEERVYFHTVDAITLLSACMLDNVGYWDIAGKYLQGYDPRLLRGLVLRMLLHRSFFRPGQQELLDRELMFDVDATADGLEELDYDKMTDLVRDIPAKDLPVLSAELYRVINGTFFCETPKVHVATASLMYNSDQGREGVELFYYLMDPSYKATILSFDALVDDRGMPVALLPKGALTPEVAAHLADVAGCVLDPDSDDPPDFRLWDPDDVFSVDKLILDEETEPMFLGVAGLVGILASTIWLSAVNFEEQFREACLQDDEDARSRGEEVEEYEFEPMEDAIRTQFTDLRYSRFFSFERDGSHYRLQANSGVAESILYSVIPNPYSMLDKENPGEW